MRFSIPSTPVYPEVRIFPRTWQYKPKKIDRKVYTFEQDKFLEDPKYSKNERALTPWFYLNVAAHRETRFPITFHVAPEVYYYRKKMDLVAPRWRTRFIGNLQTVRAFGRKPYSMIKREYWRVFNKVHALMYMHVMAKLYDFKSPINMYRNGIEKVLEYNLKAQKEETTDLGKKTRSATLNQIVPYPWILKSSASVLSQVFGIKPKNINTEDRGELFMEKIDFLYYLIARAFDYTRVPYVPYIISRQFRYMAEKDESHSAAHMAFDNLMRDPEMLQAICGYYGVSGVGGDKSVMKRLQQYSESLLEEDKFLFENEEVLDTCSKEEIWELAVRRGIYIPLKAEDLKKEIKIWLRARVREDLGTLELLVFSMFRQYLTRQKMLDIYFKQQYQHYASQISINMKLRVRDIRKQRLLREEAAKHHHHDGEHDDHHDHHDQGEHKEKQALSH